MDYTSFVRGCWKELPTDPTAALRFLQTAVQLGCDDAEARRLATLRPEDLRDEPHGAHGLQAYLVLLTAHYLIKGHA